MIVSGRTIAVALPISGKRRYNQTNNARTAGKPQPFRSLSLQNVQLMAKDEDFGFQSFMRTKAVPHISEQKSEEGRHQFRFSFLMRIQRMRFSEGTGLREHHEFKNLADRFYSVASHAIEEIYGQITPRDF